MRVSLIFALLHNIQNHREFTDKEADFFSNMKFKYPKTDIDMCVYEEDEEIRRLQETVFGCDAEKFYSPEIQKQVHEHYKNSKDILDLTDEEINALSKQNTMFNAEDYFTEEELEDLDIQEQVVNHNYMSNEISHLLTGFNTLSDDYKKVFFDCIEYYKEVSKEGLGEHFETEEMEYIEEEKSSSNENELLLKGQQLQEKMLQDMQDQLLALTKQLTQPKTKDMDKADKRLEKLKLLDMKDAWNLSDVAFYYEKGRDSIRNWANLYTDPLPNDKKVVKNKTNYKFIPSEVKKWMKEWKEILEFEQNEKPTKEEEIKAIRAKGKMSIKEFTTLHDYSDKWQKEKRGRIKDPLPAIQLVDGGKVTYNIEKVDKWMERNNL